jgi:predicted amidohydrolase
MEGDNMANDKASPTQIGRPVRIVSMSFVEKGLAQVAALVDREAARGVDVVALPETWTGQAGHEPETLTGPTITAMAAVARKHRTYIVCPIDRQDGPRRVNTAVLLDRRGQVAGMYDKVYPYWSEFDVQPPVAPGLDVPVFETDFGRLGLAICFDANFPEVWQRLAEQGTELVIWPSAYSAGATLQAHALMHHYYIVTSTGARDCLVYDITGAQWFYERAEEINVSHITLDLDRGIYHQNFNLEKRDRLLSEHGAEVGQEVWLEREQWFVLRAMRPGVSARALARAYGLEELRDYIARSRREIDALRGSFVHS